MNIIIFHSNAGTKVASYFYLKSSLSLEYIYFLSLVWLSPSVPLCDLTLDINDDIQYLILPIWDLNQDSILYIVGSYIEYLLMTNISVTNKQAVSKCVCGAWPSSDLLIYWCLLQTVLVIILSPIWLVNLGGQRRNSWDYGGEFCCGAVFGHMNAKDINTILSWLSTFVCSSTKTHSLQEPISSSCCSTLHSQFCLSLFQRCRSCVAQRTFYPDCPQWPSILKLLPISNILHLLVLPLLKWKHIFWSQPNHTSSQKPPHSFFQNKITYSRTVPPLILRAEHFCFTG